MKRCFLLLFFFLNLLILLVSSTTQLHAFAEAPDASWHSGFNPVSISFGNFHFANSSAGFVLLFELTTQEVDSSGKLKWPSKDGHFIQDNSLLNTSEDSSNEFLFYKREQFLASVVNLNDFRSLRI